jgi:hypothetical protein
MKNLLKILLAILLFICLVDMPYGYYQFVRFFSMSYFLYQGIELNNLGRKNLSYIYFLLALLFQPFFKIALGRELWNFVDVVVGLGLFLSIFIKPIKSTKDI